MEQDTSADPKEIAFSLDDDADPFVQVDPNVGVDGVDLLDDEESSNRQEFVDNLQLQTTPDGKNGSTEAMVATPAVGMTYQSWEEIDLHFRCYAKQCGFAVSRVGAGYRQKDGVITKIKRNVTWRCEQWGESKGHSEEAEINVPAVNVPNTRARTAKAKAADPPSKTRHTSAGEGGVRVGEGKTKRCNCPVKLYASASKDGSVWTIKTAILQHEGHVPSPSRVMYISEYRQQEWNPAIKRRLFNDLEAGIKIPQIHRGLARERNGIENFPLTQRDMRNEVNKKRQLEMKGGDANGMYAYLRRMSEDNDQFFYSYRLEKNGSLQDVMWVDARSRAAYQYFGDVVCFDSTYLTNDFELPFANFVGVNHHGQTILLGCALVSHEDAETFEWLFCKWLTCMGKAPIGILTDQDAAMKKALGKVMPQVRHRWCLWHILQKFYQRLGSYEHYEEITDKLQNAIYDSLTPEEFRESWEAVIKQYHLEDNDWLKGLYDNAEMWIPAYMKHMFWAGMKTTQRSESINSFFDNFVRKKTRLYEFVQQYVNAMEYRMSEEKAADADSARYFSRTVTNFSLEKLFRKFYTNGKFAEVQLECVKTMYVRPVKIVNLSEDVLEYTLTDRHYILNKKTRKEYATARRRQYKVQFNMTTKLAECVCKLFECHGIVCRHIIAVFDANDVTDIPQKYILDRWRKDIKRKHTKIKVAYYDPSKTEDVKRLDRLNVAFEPLSLDACTTEEDVDLVLDMIEKTKRLIAERRAKAKSSGQTDNIRGTPSSVCNAQHQAPDDSNNTAQGLEQDMDDHDPRQQPNSTDSDAEVFEEPIANMKDPPLKKKPAHRPREKRYLSCLERQPKKNRGKATQAPSRASSDLVPPPTTSCRSGSLKGRMVLDAYQPLDTPHYSFRPPGLSYLQQQPQFANHSSNPFFSNPPYPNATNPYPHPNTAPSNPYSHNLPLHLGSSVALETNRYLHGIIPESGMGFVQPRPFGHSPRAYENIPPQWYGSQSGSFSLEQSSFQLSNGETSCTPCGSTT